MIWSPPNRTDLTCQTELPTKSFEHSSYVYLDFGSRVRIRNCRLWKPRHSMPLKARQSQPTKAKTRKKGVLTRPDKVATLKDVAKDCGYSPITVSRVINGGQYVRKETLGAINASIAKLKYSPNLAARTLAAGKQLRIGLLFNDASNTFSSELLASSLEQARLNHVQIEVGKCDVGRHEIKVLQELLAHGVDGMIVPPPLCDSERVHRFLTNEDVLAVAVGSTRRRSNLHTVRIDDYAAAAL
jgi:LacI family transcriptional regulator